LSRSTGATVVVKGAKDIIAGGGRVRVDEEGSPYLTKGGYGDLLAGVAAAALARGAVPFDAACAAAFIVGRAGALAAAATGEGTLASDALAKIPLAIREELRR
jgi:NAD(P)H-hydrate epimerase